MAKKTKRRRSRDEVRYEAKKTGKSRALLRLFQRLSER